MGSDDEEYLPCTECDGKSFFKKNGRLICRTCDYAVVVITNVLIYSNFRILVVFFLIHTS